MFGFSVILYASTKREVGGDEWNKVCESILILEWIIFVVMTRRLFLMIFWIDVFVSACVSICVYVCICLMYIPLHVHVCMWYMSVCV